MLSLCEYYDLYGLPPQVLFLPLFCALPQRLLFFKWAIPVLSFVYTFSIGMVNRIFFFLYKNWQWLNLKPGPLVFEVISLPNVPEWSLTTWPYEFFKRGSGPTVNQVCIIQMHVLHFSSFRFDKNTTAYTAYHLGWYVSFYFMPWPLFSLWQGGKLKQRKCEQ